MARQPFIERHALWTDDQRRQAEALKDRVRTEGLRLVRLAWTDVHGYSRAKAVAIPGVPRVARRRLQHQRRDHHARLGERAHVQLVHARRRHGARRDDRLAEHHDRPRPGDVPGAAVGARRRLGALRRVLQQRRALSLLGAPPPAAAARAPARGGTRLRRRARGRVVSRPGRGGSPHRRARRRPGPPRPADRDLAGRARLLVPLRVEHGPDAAGPVGARGVVPGARPAAAVGRERMGAGTGRVHVLGATGAEGGRRPGAVPDRDAAGLPAAWATSRPSCAAPP